MKKTNTVSSFLTYYNRNGAPRGDILSFCHEHYLVSQGFDQNESIEMLLSSLRDQWDFDGSLGDPTPPEELCSAMMEYAYIDKREIEIDLGLPAHIPATSVPG
jgi:hypothetical protein